jgi:hypothetical protein
LTKIPTDPIGAALWGITLLIDVLAIPEAYERLKTGIAARAEKEGRDVTPDEEALLDALLDASVKDRDGTAPPPAAGG